MVFSSLFFVFIFLPVTLMIYFAAGKRFRNAVLLAASLFFYAWGEPVYVALMCCSILINYCIGILLSKTGAPKRKFLFIISLIFNLGCLAFFKYSGMIISAISSVSGLPLNVTLPTLPIGISFYTFQALSYIIDVYRGKINAQKNLFHYTLYISMFPQLVAGPIVNYADIESQLVERSITFETFYSGLKRFLCGLAKKVILANNIGLLWSEIKNMPAGKISVLTAWLGILAFAVQIYLDFSGYSDMAIGLGKMFGFHFKENFDYPYISRSVSEFWRRWHISLGSWFREYVYIPLGGNRVGNLKLICNLFIVWFFTGLWHGASWNFVFWGLYYGILIAAEKFFLGKYIERLPKVISHIYLLLSVGIGWVFFEFTRVSDILDFLRAMFWGRGSFADTQIIAALKNNAVLYAICIIAATPLPKKLAMAFERTYRNVYELAEPVCCCVLMFFGTAYMVGSTYNPFIYFRF